MAIKKQPNKTIKIPAPPKNPTFIPNIDPEDPVILVDDPEIVPEEDPFETPPPYEAPSPAEGP